MGFFHFKWSHLVYDYSHFALSGLYFLVFLVNSYVFLKSAYNNNLSETWKKFFHIFLLFGCALRSGFFFLQPFVMEGWVVIENKFNLFLESIPSFFFFSDYLIILILWAEIYYYPEKFSGKTLTISYFMDKLLVLQILMYVIGAILIAMDIVFEPIINSSVANDNTMFESALSGYIATLYIVCSFSFLFYGLKSISYLTVQMDNAKGREKEVVRNVIKKVFMFTLLLCSCFIVRSIIIYASMIFPVSSVSWFDVTYFTALEILPLLLMMLILIWKPNAKKREANKSNENSHLLHVND